MKVVVIGGNAAGMSFAAKYKRNQPSDDVVVHSKMTIVLPILFTIVVIARSPESLMNSVGRFVPVSITKHKLVPSAMPYTPISLGKKNFISLYDR